jgi:alanine racemase
VQDAGEARPAWAWVDLDALSHNARRAIRCAEGRTVIGVVKADGYGHGAEAVAHGLLAEGVARLAVVSVAEGAALRRAGIVAPVLLLGGLDDAAAAERAVKLGLTPVLHDERGFELARRTGRGHSSVAVEVEIDTGMRRMGLPPGDARSLLDRIAATPQLSLSGVFTHLARADDPDTQPSRDQMAIFARILEGFDPGEASPPVLHSANSAGLLRLPEIEVGVVTGAVRPGLMLYGVSPFSDRTAESLDLEPVMTLAARVVALRQVAKGESVGYGGEWRAPQDTTVATLPLGYADGIPRAVLGRGKVHLGGSLCPIVGRVSMDYITVDVGRAAVEIGAVATIFGRTPEGVRVPVEDFAAAAGTIGYESLVGVGARVPRKTGRGGPAAADRSGHDRAV